MPRLIQIQFVAILGALFWVGAFALPAAGQQQVTVTAPMQGVNDGFFEGVSIGFGASGKGWFFNNGLGPVAPQFGGFDPNAGANFGFGINFPGGSGFFNLSAVQGSSRGFSSVSPSVTMIDGGTGYIAAVTQQPFVIGIVPVVGGFGGATVGGVGGGGQFGVLNAAASSNSGQTALDDRLARIRAGESSTLNSGSGSPSDSPATTHGAAKQSSAATPTASIAAIRQQQSDEEAAAAREVQSLLDQGRKAQAAGKTSVARTYYQQADRRANGALKQQVQEALHSLGDSPASR